MRSIPQNQITYKWQNKNKDFDQHNLEHVHINPAILESEKDSSDETLSDWTKTLELDLKNYLQYKYVYQTHRLQTIFNQQKINGLTTLLFSNETLLVVTHYYRTQQQKFLSKINR